MHQVFPALPAKAHLSVFRSLSTLSCCFYLAVALGLAAEGQDQEEEKPPPARQNLILRDYFRKQLTDLRSFDDDRMTMNDRFVESFIDRQIDHYLRSLRDKLDLLDQHFAHLEEIQTDILAGKNTRDTGRLWKDTLNQIEDEAGDLRRMLSFVFTELEDEDDFKPESDRKIKGSSYPQELHLLGVEIEKANQRIGEYLFEPTNTVRLEDLRGENMLIHLRRVQELAKILNKFRWSR